MGRDFLGRRNCKFLAIFFFQNSKKIFPTESQQNSKTKENLNQISCIFMREVDPIFFIMSIFGGDVRSNITI